MVDVTIGKKKIIRATSRHGGVPICKKASREERRYDWKKENNPNKIMDAVLIIFLFSYHNSSLNMFFPYQNLQYLDVVRIIFFFFYYNTSLNMFSFLLNVEYHHNCMFHTQNDSALRTVLCIKYQYMVVFEYKTNTLC